MQLLHSGRAIVILQWVLAVVLPAFVAIGRGFVGAQLGWMAVFGVFYGPILIVALLVPPILVLFDRPARHGRTVRRHYATATIVLWIALVVAGLSIPDAGDSGSVPTALSTWTGMSDEASGAIFTVAAVIAVLSWGVALVMAIVGIRRGRSDAT